MEWNDVLEKLNRANAAFLQGDGYLLEVNANERSMTHKFAEHLQKEFESWKVDCEYNRDGDIPKRLRWMLDENISPADEHAQTVFPDIIVHHRGKQSADEHRNLLVIEAKKTGTSDERDREKLAAFQTSEYRYRFAVLVLFITKGQPDIEITPLSNQYASSLANQRTRSSSPSRSPFRNRGTSINAHMRP